MSDTNMNCSLSMEGSLCGCNTVLCGSYYDGDMAFASKIVVTKESLESLIKVLGAETQEKVAPFVKLLDDFCVTSTFSYEKNTTMIQINTDGIRFLGIDTAQGKLVRLDISYDEVSGTKDKTLHSLVEGVNTVLGIKKFVFLYRNTNLTNSDAYQKYSELPDIPANIKGNIILNAQFKFDDVGNFDFTKAMSELFGIREMEAYLYAGGSEFGGALTVPDIDNELLRCRNVMLEMSFSSKGVRFAMSGSIALKCLSGLEFSLNCEISMISVSISASTMTSNAYRIPHTPITICNSGLEIGVSERGLDFSIMTQINITNLMWFGALSISYQGATASLDMLSMAMNEVSLSSLVENLTGLSNEGIKALDVVAVKAFELNTNTKIDYKSKTDDEIVEQINKSLSGMNEEFLLDKNATSITRMPGGNSCDVLNTNTMFHYWIDSEGNLQFPPQAYYASKHIKIGSYNFEKGIFFAGRLVIFGEYVKVMFSTVYGEGLLGYAQIKPISTKVLKMSGSVSSAKIPNLVLGTAENSTLSLLVPDSKAAEKPAVLYVNVSKNSYNFYIDAHFELCNVFSFDTLLYYMNKKVCLAVSTNYFNMISASIMISADYSSMTNAAFMFEVSLDCTGLHDKLTSLSKMIDSAVESYNKKISDAQKKIQNVKNKVSSLTREVDSYIRKIDECKRKISNTKKIKRWIVAIEEGIKITAYEVAIVSLRVAVKTAQAALDIANNVLKLSAKVGTSVMNAVNSVINGVLEVFYINKALLNIIVNGKTQIVSTELDVTVLGREFNVNQKVDLLQLAKKPIEFLEEAITKEIKDFISQLRSGEYAAAPYESCLEYRYMDEEQDVLQAAEMVAYGTHRVEQAGEMIADLQKMYVDEMHQVDPDFDRLETTYKDVTAFLSYTMEKSSQNLYADGMDELMGELKQGLENNVFSEEEADMVNSCIEQYVNEIRPANTTVSETSVRADEIAGNTDTDSMKQYFCQSGVSDSDYTGTDVIENRDYARFYNEAEAIIEKYYPQDSGNGYFNFTDEETFYEMLNEARKEAGCAYVAVTETEESEEAGLVQFVKEKPVMRKNSNYRQRFI